MAFCGNWAIHGKCSEPYDWLYLDDPSNHIYVTDVKGLGMPPVEYSKRPNVLNRGDTLLSRRTTSREIVIELLVCGCLDCEQSIQQLISRITNCSAPCPDGDCLPGYLTNINDDGDLCFSLEEDHCRGSCILSYSCCDNCDLGRRAIEVSYVGPDGEPERIQSENGQDCWRVRLKFFAQNPESFSLTRITQSTEAGDISWVTGATSINCSLPNTVINGLDATATFSIDYNGDTYGYPIIDITGVACIDSIVINGNVFEVNHNLTSANSLLTIDFRPSVRRAFLPNGQSIPLPRGIIWKNFVLEPGCVNSIVVNIRGYGQTIFEPPFVYETTADVYLTYNENYLWLGC